MSFTEEELVKIAAWTPITPGYDREDATIKIKIGPILARIRSDRRLGLSVTQDGGLSNYFAFLVYEAAVVSYPPGRPMPLSLCIAVQLSLMTPVGVIGYSTFSKDNTGFAWTPLEPESVCDPSSPSDWISAAVIAAVQETSPYILVGREVTDQPLPQGVEIYEYCLCEEPWNRAFHALFADTD